MIFSHGSSNQKAVLAVLRYLLEYKMLSPEAVDDEGRLKNWGLIHSHAVGELSTSQKQAVITPTEKKGRDKRLVKNSLWALN